MTILETILEWQRLDDAAFIDERSLESALDLYCAGRGPAPTPAEQAVAGKLRLFATARVLVIQRELCQVLVDRYVL